MRDEVGDRLRLLQRDLLKRNYGCGYRHGDKDDDVGDEVVEERSARGSKKNGKGIN